MAQAEIPAKTSPAKKNWLLLGIGFAISAGLIFILSRSIEWHSFVRELGRVQPVYLPLFMCVVGATYWVRSVRWKYLLPPDYAPGFSILFDAISVGALATFVLPFRAGEFVRAFAMGRWGKIPVALVFASVIIERVFDVFALLVLLGLCLLRLENVPPSVTVGAVALGAVAGAIMLVMLASYLASEHLLRFAGAVLTLLLPARYAGLRQKIIGMLSELVAGFKAIRSFGQLALIVIWSFVLWILFGMMALIAVWSFGESANFWVGMGTNAMIALAVAVPSAPGFLGTFHGGCVAGLAGLYGYPQDFALAVGVVLHALNVVAIFAIGFWSLHRRKARLGELSRG